MAVAINRLSASRPVGMGMFVVSLLYFFLFLTPYSTAAESKPGRLYDYPLFPSQAYIEVQYPEENSPDTNIVFPWRVFKSSPCQPPSLDFTHNGEELSPGYLILDPKSRGGNGSRQSFPIIIRQDGELVFCLDDRGQGNNFRVQMIDDKPHLTAWHGAVVRGYGFGYLVTFDAGYRPNKIVLNATIDTNFPGKAPGPMDFHEQLITPQGTVLVTAYNRMPYDLRPVGGKIDMWLADSMIFEIDIKTKETIWSWSALDHFKIARSKQRMPSYLGNGTHDNPYDFFHINSIQPIGDDALLISSPHLWSVYLISRKTGNVIWELSGSGEGGDFGPLPPDGQFRWHHHVRAHNITNNSMVISIFDNHNNAEDLNVTNSRALALGITLPPDPSTPPVVLRRIEPEEEKLFVPSQGSYDPELSNGNQLIGYGQLPIVREYGPSGDVRWNCRFGYKGRSMSYRTYKSEWRATPALWKPSLVMERKGDKLTAYVSWNGATEVEYWNIYEVEKGVGLARVGKAQQHGFETMIQIPDQYKGMQCMLVAVVQDGKEVAQSNTACIKEFPERMDNVNG